MTKPTLGRGASSRRRGPKPKSKVPTWTSPWRRGVPVPPGEDPVAEGAGAPQAIGSVLEGLLGSAGPWQAGLALGELGRRWPEVVGQPLDRETAPGSLDARGTLTIRASSSAWAVQIRFLAAALAANANEILGRQAVTEVRVSVDSALAGGPGGAGGPDPPIPAPLPTDGR